MTAYLISLVMGLAVGAVYGLVQFRSPAPPLIALVGLLGMVLGEQAVGAARRHLAPPAPSAAAQASGEASGEPEPPARHASP